MSKPIICKDVFGKEYACTAKELDVRIGVHAVIVEDGKMLLTR